MGISHCDALFSLNGHSVRLFVQTAANPYMGRLTRFLRKHLSPFAKLSMSFIRHHLDTPLNEYLMKVI